MSNTSTHPDSRRTALDIRESAERRGCSTRTIYRKVKSGELAHFRFGQRIFIPIEEHERIERGSLTEPNK